jgi:hypothetical protein
MELSAIQAFLQAEFGFESQWEEELYRLTLPADQILPVFSFLWNNRLVQGFQPLYSIKKIQVPEYIKNRYQPPFCWSCFTPYGEILYEIACSVCEKMKFENENLDSEPDIVDKNITEYLNGINHLESDIINNNKIQYLNEMNYVNYTENINYMFPNEIIEPLFYLTKNQPTYDTVFPKAKENTTSY